jgi:hypothetical protein
MATIFRLIAFACIFALVTTASADGPVTWDDIRELKRAKSTYSDIVKSMQDRGLAFPVDRLEERRLRAYGFTRRHIADIRKIGVKVTNIRSGGDATKFKPDDTPLPPIVPAKLQLDAETEAAHRRTADMVDRMIEASEVLIQRNPSTHVTLVANKNIAARYLPDIGRLERKIRKTFHEPIASGVDLRAANIVLLENRYEYEKWTRALFKTIQDDGFDFQVEDPAAQALKGESFLVQGIYTVCLAKMQSDEARRRVAFAVGFQYMRQLTQFNAPDALTTGFGDVTEVMMFKHPTMMVQSAYHHRKLAGTSRVWPQLVQERFKQGKIASVQNVLAYSMGSMTPPEYAEAWSLTSFLARQPDQFAALVKALPDSSDKWTTIAKIYGLDEATLLKDWRAFAAAQ